MYAALKAGAKIHGEPKERDSVSGYYSAAVIDFDGNSIEAVYRSGNSVVASEAGGPTIALLENGSVASRSSKASTIKAAESVAAPRSEAKSHAVSKAAAPSVVSHRSNGPPPSYTMQTVQKVDDGSKTAKTIVGTLIGAAAGAAIAYAMVKGESQSSSSETKTNPPPQYTPESHQLMAPSQVSHSDEQRHQPAYQAIEGPPSRSVYSSASGPRSTLTRSVSSKNPRASTVYEGTQFFLDENGRRASDGSIFSIPEDIPLRAIQNPPSISNNSQERYPCNPSTIISSYAANKPRSLAGPGSVHSTSTIKASHASIQRRHSHDDRDTYSSHSQHHSQIYRANSTHSHQHSVSKSATMAPNDTSSNASSTRSARHIPLPAGSSATYYSTHSVTQSNSNSNAGNNSYVSARGVPLPESVVDLDLDSHVTPDDSISQVGSRSAGRSTHSHSHSHRSSHSKASSRTSRHSSKSRTQVGDVVKPADSVSQVSRASQRTVKAGDGGSKAPSKASSRRGSQIVQ